MRLIFLIFSITIFSKEITGVVRDISSSKPLFGVSIISNNKTIAKTDSLGKFFLQISDTLEHLDFELESYEDKHLYLDPKKSIDIYLVLMHPLEFHMDNILISDELISNESRLSGSKVIRGVRLDENLKSTIAGTIKNEAGIGIRSMGPAPARPVYRGMGGSSIQINQNGMQNIDVSNNSPDHAVAIDPFTTKDVKILHGAKTLIYSPVASSAVIDLSTKNIPETKLHKSQLLLRNQYESVNNSWHGNIEGLVPIGKNIVKINLAKKLSDNIQTPVGALDNTGINTFNYNLGLSRITDNYLIGASYNELYNNYGIPPGGIGQHPKGVDVELFKRLIDFQFQYHLHNDLLDDINFKFNRTYFKQEEFESSGIVGARFLLTNYNFRLDINGKGLFFFDEGIYGINSIIEHYDVGGAVRTPELRSYENSVFTYQKYSDKYNTFELSLRYDNIQRNPISDVSIGFDPVKNRSFNIFTGSASYFRNFEKFILGFNIYRGSRAPTGEELYSDGPHLAAYSYDLGNEELDVLSVFGAEGNFRIGNRNNLTLNVFYNYYDNYLTPRNSGLIDSIRTGLPIFEADGAKSVFTGFELSTSLYYKRFSFYSDLSYTYAHNLTDDFAVAMIPPLKGHININYEYQNLRFFINSEFANSQQRVDQFELPTNSYLIIDIGTSYNLNLMGSFNRIGFKIENVLDQEYYNHLSRIKELMPEPGINFKLFFNNYL